MHRPLVYFLALHVGLNYGGRNVVIVSWKSNQFAVMGKDKKAKRRSTGLTEDILESKTVRPSGRSKQRRERQGESDDAVRVFLIKLIFFLLRKNLKKPSQSCQTEFPLTGNSDVYTRNH